MWFELSEPFPERMWWDLAVLVLTQRTEALLAAEVGADGDGVQFYDGPFRVRITRIDGELLGGRAGSQPGAGFGADLDRG